MSAPAELDEPLGVPPPLAERLLGPRGSYHATRFVLLRFLGFIYSVAFFVAWKHTAALLSSRGLVPAGVFLDRVAAVTGSRADGFLALPTLFWLDASDGALRVAGLAGLRALARSWSLGVDERARHARALGALPVVRPRRADLLRLRLGDRSSSRPGFLAIFLCPVVDAAARSARSPPPPVVIWLLRWLIVRIMLGAGLIKLRGDPCWRDLTCLVYHYETQPIPNPLSLAAPPAARAAFHAAGVALQPRRRARRAVRSCFGPRRARHVGGRAVRRLPGDADRERQPLVPELAHDRAGARVLRRRLARARAACARSRARGARRGTASAERGRAALAGDALAVAGRGAQRRAGREPALAAPGDEHARSIRCTS